MSIFDGNNYDLEQRVAAQGKTISGLVDSLSGHAEALNRTSDSTARQQEELNDYRVRIRRLEMAAKYPTRESVAEEVERLSKEVAVGGKLVREAATSTLVLLLTYAGEQGFFGEGDK